MNDSKEKLITIDGDELYCSRLIFESNDNFICIVEYVISKTLPDLMNTKDKNIISYTKNCIKRLCILGIALTEKKYDFNKTYEIKKCHIRQISFIIDEIDNKTEAMIYFLKCIYKNTHVPNLIDIIFVAYFSMIKNITLPFDEDE
jgi:hypothetical protein